MLLNINILYNTFIPGWDNPRLYPYDLKCLEHKKMAFKIDVNSFNVSNNYNRFGILGYTVDSNVIDALEKKLAVEVFIYYFYLFF